MCIDRYITTNGYIKEVCLIVNLKEFTYKIKLLVTRETSKTV